MANSWPLNKIVELEWVDSCANTSGWDSVEHYKSSIGEVLCRSVGYLLEETRDFITVATSMDIDTGNISNTISIPKVAVVRKHTLNGAFK